MEHPLDGVRAKLTRARAHIGELDACIKRFLESQPYGFIPRKGPDPADVLVVVRERRYLPATRLGAIAGDVVHNIHSALDQLVWALTARHQRRVPREPIRGRDCPWRKIAFPIFLTEERWKAGNARCLWGVRPGLWSDFKSEQPFAGGGYGTTDPLWITHELWNRDKHREIVVVMANTVPKPGASVGAFLIQRIFSGVNQLHVRERLFGPIKDGKAILRVNVPPGTSNVALRDYLREDANLAFDVTFEQGPPGLGLSLRSILEAALRRATRIADRFAREFSTPRHVATARSNCPALR